ncbi:hypothetical protein KGA66_28035 [Actinocrinis puniceicyclus]|uniref:Uncharacterized protein n=1 Tax=Actinocrinis puniceicyclus TaxID=977794 RepID=A0A8J7WQT1_9ACTN|nr:hypothetical protein [Actinocrinis puniceicyclus]MBS2966916.1 hypothetical protein [Actinocrinis puniceicyclus]
MTDTSADGPDAAWSVLASSGDVDRKVARFRYAARNPLIPIPVMRHMVTLGRRHSAPRGK